MSSWNHAKHWSTETAMGSRTHYVQKKNCCILVNAIGETLLKWNQNIKSNQNLLNALFSSAGSAFLSDCII